MLIIVGRRAADDDTLLSTADFTDLFICLKNFNKEGFLRREKERFRDLPKVFHIACKEGKERRREERKERKEKEKEKRKKGTRKMTRKLQVA